MGAVGGLVMVQWLIAVGLVAGTLSQGGRAPAGKPFLPPVKIECPTPTADAKAGDVVDTEIRFRALDNLDSLEVTVAPFFGVQVVSQPAAATFANMNNGEERVLQVKVRLLEKQGSLGVSVETVKASNKDTAAGAVTIEYGSRK